MDASCGALVIQNIDISISEGTLIVTPTHVKWTTGMVATAVGNNKIVRFQHDRACHCCISSRIMNGVAPDLIRDP